MSKINDIEKEIEALVNVGSNGSGYGDPDYEKSQDRKLLALMNEKTNLKSKEHTKMEWIGISIAIVSLLLTIYQQFVK